MVNRDKSNAQYIESSIISSKARAEGDYKVANEQAKIQNKIFKQIEEGKLDANILVELLDHGYIGVSAIAAIDLLRIGYEESKAEKTLEKIALMDESGKGIDEKLTIMAASYQLKSWKEKGFVSR